MLTRTSEETSKIMRSIRSKDTKPEICVRKFLHSCGFRYRLHSKKLPGKPDIVLPKYKLIIQVHGCFWHTHGPTCLNKSKPPKSNIPYWGPKLERNKARDLDVETQLRKLGWEVLTIWECALEGVRAESTLTDLATFIRLKGITANTNPTNSKVPTLSQVLSEAMTCDDHARSLQTSVPY